MVTPPADLAWRSQRKTTRNLWSHIHVELDYFPVPCWRFRKKQGGLPCKQPGKTGWNREVLRPSILLALAQIDQITFPLHADFYISNASKACMIGCTWICYITTARRISYRNLPIFSCWKHGNASPVLPIHDRLGKFENVNGPVW